MFDRDRVFAEFALFALIGVLAAMATGAGVAVVIGLVMALVFLRLFLVRLP